VRTVTFSGLIGFPPSGVGLVFVGPTAAVTLATPQRLTASAVAALGATTGTAHFHHGICTQIGNNALDELQTSVASSVGAGRTSVFSTASAEVPAGEYKVGFCLSNNSAHDLNNNEGVMGWVMVTN